MSRLNARLFRTPAAQETFDDYFLLIEERTLANGRILFHLRRKDA